MLRQNRPGRVKQRFWRFFVHISTSRAKLKILGLKRVQFLPYQVSQFLIERVIELSSIFPMARMSNLQPTRAHTFSLDISNCTSYSSRL